MEDKNKQKINWVGISSVLFFFFLLFFVFPRFIFSDSTIVCATYVGECESARSHPAICFKFKINNVTREAHFDRGLISNEKITSIKSGECLEIEVSNYWYSMYRIYEKE